MEELSELVGIMPCSHQKIEEAVEKLVKEKKLPKSSPPATTNHAVVSALVTINNWIKKAKN